MRLSVGIAAALAVAACGGERVDPLPRLARAVPASAHIVVAVDGPRIRGSWIAAAARSLRALVPADRGCLVDAALAADRAVIAELAVGRLVVIAAKTKPPDCRALSQVESGIWIATLVGGAAPAAKEPRLTDRPDFADIRAALAAPIAAVAPDGDPSVGVVWAAAAITDPANATLTVDLESPDRAKVAETWLRGQLAAATDRLGDAAPLVKAIAVTTAGAAVTLTLHTDAATATRTGPIAVVAAVAALAAREAVPTAEAPACGASHWHVACRDGREFELPASLRPTIEAEVRAARPTPRVVGGQPAGVRLNTVAPDGVLAALGVRPGDVVIALHGRRLDTRESLDVCIDQLRSAEHVELTIERGAASFVFSYLVK